MIERAEFARGWKRLEARFGEQTEGVAGAYYEYLTDRMGTDAFVDACRAVWATREFFPRPADFLQVGAESDWRILVDAFSKHGPPEHLGWSIFKDSTERAQEAVRSLGGFNSMHKAYNRNPLQARKAFREAYASMVVEDAIQQLPEGDRGPVLPPGVEVGSGENVEVSVERLK